MDFNYIWCDGDLTGEKSPFVIYFLRTSKRNVAEEKNKNLKHTNILIITGYK
jgi:hypothetical protein